MPIYEYVCPSCQLKFEVLHRSNQNGKSASCPSCQGSAQKVLSIFASFSKSSEGVSTPIAGSAPSCSACNLTSCDTCG